MSNFHIRIEDCTEAQKARLAQVYGDSVLDFGLFGIEEKQLTYGIPNGEPITPDEMFKRLGLDMCACSLDNLSAPFELHSSSFEGEPLTLAQPANEMMHDVHEDLKAAEQKIKELESDKEHGTKIYKQLFDQYVKLQDDFKDLEQQLDKVSSQRDELFQDNETLRVKQPLDVDWSCLPDDIHHIVQNLAHKTVFTTGYGALDSSIHRVIATRPKPKYTDEQLQPVKDFWHWFVSGDTKQDVAIEQWLKEQGQ